MHVRNHYQSTRSIPRSYIYSLSFQKTEGSLFPDIEALGRITETFKDLFLVSFLKRVLPPAYFAKVFEEGSHQR